MTSPWCARGSSTTCGPKRVLTWLPPGESPAAGRPGLDGAEHSSRRLLNELAAGSTTAADALRLLYDEQAAEWSEWCASQPDYVVPLEDGLRRGVRRPVGRALEVSAGTGQATRLLARAFPWLVATDASAHMVARLRGVVPVEVPCLIARSDALPFAPSSFDLVVGLNAVPDLAEFRRVLRPLGMVLWVSSFGDETPLYVTPEQLASEWGSKATAAAAAHGNWLVLER